jgi:hypothetical protein
MAAPRRARQRDFWITNTEELARLQKQLRRAGRGDLSRSVNERIRKAARPIHRDLQQAVRTLPIRGKRRKSRRSSGPSPTTRPLRPLLADAIRLSVTTGKGARIWVDAKRLPPDLKNMIRDLDKGHWRHPVFGNEHLWVDQYAKKGWWWGTIRPHMPRLNSAVKAAMRDVERRLK